MTTSPSSRSRPRRLLDLLAPALTLVLLAAGCSADSGASSPETTSSGTPEPPERIGRYVALGDSFTAAPLVPTTDVADGCFRSTGNYPALVADRLDVRRLVDVSCSGATTDHLTSPQRTFGDARVPPQLRAVDERTDLVTVGIGGNDFGLFASLVGRCAFADPGRGGRSAATACAHGLATRSDDLRRDARRVEQRVVRALREVHQRAPRAAVLLVGYPRLLPASGRCRALPVAPEDLAAARRVAAALDRSLARAARRTGTGFVDLHRLSAGHDVCSDEPWVNGRRTRRDAALAFHPFAAGMEAAADAVVAEVSRRAGD